jgi:hypothetical protein
MIFSEFRHSPLPFQDLLDKMKKKFPKYHVHAQFYQEDLSFKLNYLALITLRYTHTKKRFVELFGKRLEMTSEETFEFLQSVSALQLDADSFLIFSRIVLDRIPIILQPLYKGIVTKNEPSTINMKKHLDWFSKNAKDVIDSVFLSKMIIFKKFFEEELREPRNEIVVHPKRKHYRSSISNDGTLTRHEYEYDNTEKIWKPVKIMPIKDIDYLYKEIWKFILYLNEFFLSKFNV